MSHGIGVAHLPRRCQPRTGHTDDRAAPSAPVAPSSSRPASASSAPARTGHRRPSRLPMDCIALVANADGTTLVGWDDSGDEPIPITLPKGDDDLGRSGPGRRPRRDPRGRDDSRPATRSISASGSSGGRVKPVGPNGAPGPWTRHVRELGTGRRSLRDPQRRPGDRRRYPGRADRPVGVDRLRDPDSIDRSSPPRRPGSTKTGSWS